MNKYISLVLVVLSLLSFVACGKNNPASTEDSSKQNDVTQTKEITNNDVVETEPADENQENTTETSSFFNEDSYTITDKSTYEYSENTYSISTEYQLIETCFSELPAEITIDSTKIVFGVTTVAELIQNGWSIESGADPDSVVSEHIHPAVAKSLNGKYVTIYGSNRTGAPAQFTNCTIVNLNIKYDNKAVWYDGLTEAADFHYDNGITCSSSYTDVINLLGDPKYIRITENFEDGQCSNKKIVLFYASQNDEKTEITFTFVDDRLTVKMTEFDYSL